MKRLIGDPLKAAALFLAAVLIGASFQDAWLGPLAYVGLVIIGVLIERRYAKLLPAIVAGITLQLIGVEWTLHTFGTLQDTMARTTNWLLLGVLFGGVIPIVMLAGVRLRNHGWPLWLVLPVVWTVADFVRYGCGLLVSNAPYPWLTLGLSQTELAIVCQVADLGGVWAIGFMVTLFAGMVAQSVVEKRILPAPAIILVIAIVYGQWRTSSRDFVEGPTVALMPSDPAEVPDVDIAIWSESAFDHYESQEGNATLLQGFRRESDGEIFNSVAVLRNGELIGCYDKCNLVPYSEYQPFGWPGRRVTAGTGPGFFERGDFKFGVAICYDVCFGEFMRQYATSDFIIISANESIDPSMILPYQLLAMTRLRAIENRKSIVRNANGGYSGIVDGNGRLSAVWQNFKEPMFLGPVPIDGRVSLYSRLGPWLPLACCLALVIGVCRRSRLHPVPDVGRNLVKDEVN